MALLIIGTVAVGTISSNGQTQVYYQDFDADDSANWASNSVATGGAAVSYNGADWNFDYSTVGIPSAPHSVGGTTKGLKLWANLGPGGTTAAAFPCGISVSPTNFPITDNFEMHFDLWLNYVKSGVGSTEIAGAGYGTAGTTPQVAGASFDSTVIGVETDHGNTSDVRVYGSAHASSYQDGSSVITSSPFPASPYVYAGTNRNTANPYYAPIFPAQDCPATQTNLFPRQTGLTAPVGNCAFKWHDVALKKVANVLTYKIDGNLIATADTVDAGTAGGTYILFNMFDVNGGGSSDIDSTNLQFALFDNIRITNFPSVVTVTADATIAYEAGSIPGVFRIYRSEAGPQITVNYTISGTAINGVDYTNALGGPLSGTVTIPVGQTDASITIVPIDDSISELTETVVLTVTDGTGYVGAGSATVSIIDNDPVTFDVSVVQPNMYERHTNDLIKYRLQRRGDLTPPVASVNLSWSGTAVSGVDFVPANGIVVDAGAATADFTITPIDNNLATGNKQVTVTVVPGTDYTPGTTSPSATGTIIDDEVPPATVIYVNPLTSAADASNWTITYGTGDQVNFPLNYNVDFGYDLTTDPGGDHGIIPLPPSGATKALRITCNKQVNPGDAGGVNVYLTNKLFSGDYAVRFNLNVIQGGNLTAGSEGVLFGINHTGTQSNWWFGSGPAINPPGATWGSDGIWYYFSADAGSDVGGDYFAFTGAGGTNGNTGWQRLLSQSALNLVDSFKNNPGPFTCLNTLLTTRSGVPVNGSPLLGLDASAWADVQIKQIKNVVTLSIDRTTIFTYTNTTVWTNGYLMLGYIDPYGGATGTSVGNADAAAYFSDLQVVQLGVKISRISLGSGNNTINYTSADADDTALSYTLQSASAVTGPYTDVSPAAAITQVGAGAFQAVTAQAGPATFYRLHHK